MSIRYRTSTRGLKDVPMPSRRSLLQGASEDIRRTRMHNSLRKVRMIRQTQQAESGLAEFIFELIPVLGGERLKTAAMTDKQAGIRNASIRELGLAWRRCSY